MARTDHFALLVTINHYPGLQSLQGPENDGLAYKEWLLDPAGADLDPAHVRHICSSDFDAADNPYDANPTEREFVRALDNWLRIKGGWKDRAGARLYLFFAGHGFTAGSSISDPALFSAIAQTGDPAHIAGYRYAAKIANAGFFDEIVLVMDCCQDVLKASQVLEPTWSPPDRNQSANVKLLQAYGAPRGRKAFEDKLTPGGNTRGLFSTVWLEALKSALPDSKGWVTGQAVKNQVLQLWAKHFKEQTNYDPPVRLPDGEDIRLYQRPSGAGVALVTLNVSALVAGGGQGLKAVRGVHQRRVRKVRSAHVSGPFGEVTLQQSYALDAKADGTVSMPPGLYSLEGPGDSNDLVIEVLPTIGTEPSISGHSELVKASGGSTAGSPVRVNLTCSDAGLDIVLVDANFSKIGVGAGQLSLDLPDGLYKAQVKAPGAVSETFIRVQGQPLDLRLATPRFASAAPISGTATTREYQRNPAIEASIGPAHQTIGSAEGELFVFVRDSAHMESGEPLASPYPWDSLRIVGLTTPIDVSFIKTCSINARAGYAFCKLAVPAGTFALILERPRGEERDESGMLAQVVPSWRTDLFLDCINDDPPDRAKASDGWSKRVPDLSSACMFLSKSSVKTPLMEPSGRTTEVARLRLLSNLPSLVPNREEAATAPMKAIFAAYAAAMAARPAVEQVLACLETLPQLLRESLTDAILLDIWCRNQSFGQENPSFCEGKPLLPLISAGWELLGRTLSELDVNREASEAIGQWRLAGSVWTHWKQPKRKADLLRLGLREAGSETMVADFHEQLDMQLTPPWTLEAWVPVLSGLRDPDPEYSPFQQALRRRVLDGICDGEFASNVVPALASAFGISFRLAAEAYSEVYEHARSETKSKM